MELELPPDFKELLESLNRHGVRYLLIGGYAVGLYGHARTTNDIDIVVADDPENAQKVVDALTEFGFGGGELSTDLFTRKESLVIMGVEPVTVDILNYLTGGDFNQAYSRRRTVAVEDIEITLISYEDLITNKRATGRLKDLADIDELEKINS